MLEGCSRKAGSGTGIAERTKYGNLDKPALKEGDGFLTGFKAYKQTQGGGRLSRGALVRKSLENQLEFSQQGRLFREISSFVEEVPPLGTHCRGEEIMKTTALKDSLWGFFPQLLFDDRSGWSDWSSQFHWKLFAPFGFSGITNLSLGKLWRCTFQAGAVWHQFPGNCFPRMDKPQSSALP